jgi:hypothetical protein
MINIEITKEQVSGHRTILKPRLLVQMAVVAFILAVLSVSLFGTVPTGSRDGAVSYYHSLAAELEFKDASSILDSTLDDLLAYAGYAGLSARDLQRLSPDLLMNPALLGQPCSDGSTSCLTAVDNQAAFVQAFGVLPIRPGSILASRFFAPKITNVNDPANSRKLGWRKLIRVRIRPGSVAAKHQIDSVIILFNFFTDPPDKPFEPTADSVNTQVMLTTLRPERDAPSMYWLDYGPLSKGGKLSLELDASFDAADLQDAPVPGLPPGARPYFVPDGCNGCHGADPVKPLINYLDTDHWFDRLDNDFSRVVQEGLPVLFDAHTNDASTSDFARAFDVIRQFNEEAERHAAVAKPTAPHLMAAGTWLRLHDTSNRHVPPVEQSLPSTQVWTTQQPNDAEAIGLLNQYCFRCHGTIKFNVFDKGDVALRHAQLDSRLNPTPAQMRLDPSFLMPPDRTLDSAVRDRLRQILP